MPFPPTPNRKRVGYGLMITGISMSLFTAYAAHVATVDTKNKQALAGAIATSDNYPCIVVDNNHDVVEWNDGMESLTGISSSAIKGQHLKLGPKGKEIEDAIIGALNDKEHWGKLVQLQSVIDVKDKQIPVQVNIRIIPVGTTQVFAVVRIDKVSNIVELGSKPDR
jgi:PAS domain-containing protein